MLSSLPAAARRLPAHVPCLLLRSLLVQRVLPDGRYLKHFESMDARESLRDGTVATWRIEPLTGVR